MMAINLLHLSPEVAAQQPARGRANCMYHSHINSQLDIMPETATW
jgi:hypothetical protein